MKECTCLHEASDGIAGTVNFILIIVILPILSVLGVFFNLLNIHIFSEQKSAASRYLTALSCSDVGVCVAGILVICSDSLRAHVFWVDQLFVFLLPKLIPLGLFFQMLSVYITVLAAFDCFYSVYSGVCGDRVRDAWAPRVLSGVVITVALYNVIQFMDLQSVECVHPDFNFTLFELCPTDLRVSDTYVTVYKGYMYALSMAFIPFVLLSALTLGILAMLRQRERVQKLDSECSPEEEGGSPTVLLLVILLFLVCNVTSLLVNVFDMLKLRIDIDVEAILIDIGNLLVVFNATANFVVYYFSSAEYRDAADRIFRKGFTRITRRGDVLSPARPDFL